MGTMRSQLRMVDVDASENPDVGGVLRPEAEEVCILPSLPR